MSKSQPLRWLVAFLLPGALIGVLKWVDTWVPPPADFRIEQVKAIASPKLSPPGADESWTTRSLPLLIRDVQLGNSIWYRISVRDLPFINSDMLKRYAAESWLLSVGSPMGSVALFHNGRLVEEVGRRADPVRVFRQPIAISLAPSMLQPDDVLHVNFRRPNSRGYVYWNYLAPKSLLQPYQERQAFLRTQLPLLLLAVMMTVGVAMLLLHWLRPIDSVYGWWAMMLFAWALREYTDLAPEPWISHPGFWLVVREFGLGGFAIFGYLFIKRYLGINRSRLDLGVWVSTVVWSAILLYLAYADVLNRDITTKFWTPFVVVIACLCCFLLARAVVQRGSSETGWLLAVCWCVTAVGIYDFKVPINPYEIAGWVQYLQYSAGLVLIVFTFILMRRFASALTIAEQTNVELEERVAQQRLELEATYERSRASESQQLVSEERERIMRDMHDGIGGQLVQALSIVAQDSSLMPVEAPLREALDDLRLIIDSLSVPEGNLSVLLGTFRHRLSQPIERAGLRFDWEMQDLPDSSHLSQSDLLHVLRILQESVTNILKHAGATSLLISTRVEAGEQIVITVVDNGCGLKPSSPAPTGRGLPGMNKRAVAIGAHLSIDSSEQGTGTTVQLRLPVAV